MQRQRAESNSAKPAGSSKKIAEPGRGPTKAGRGPTSATRRVGRQPACAPEPHDEARRRDLPRKLARALALVRDAVAGTDTFALRVTAAPAAYVWDLMRDAFGKRMSVSRGKFKSKGRTYTRREAIVLFQRTTPEEREFVALHFPDHKLRRVDVFVDLCTATKADARKVGTVFRRHLVPRYPSRRGMLTDGSVCFSARAGSPRVVAQYHTKPSKVNGLPCSHTELRLTGSGALSRHKLRMLPDPDTVDKHALLRDELRFMYVTNPDSFDAAVDELLDEKATRTLRRELRRRRKRRYKPMIADTFEAHREFHRRALVRRLTVPMDIPHLDRWSDAPCALQRKVLPKLCRRRLTMIDFRDVVFDGFLFR